MMRMKDRATGAVRPGYWFRPKRFGYGATPVTWQGWAAVAAMILAAGLIAKLAEHRGPGFAWMVVPLLAGFVALCWAKTDGGWAWRWGTKDKG